MAKGLEQVGTWAFLVGAGLSVLTAVASNVIPIPGGTMTSVLAVLGLVVGLLNITAKEREAVIIASLGMIVAGLGALAILPGGDILKAIFTSLGIFATPVAAISGLLLFVDKAMKR